MQGALSEVTGNDNVEIKSRHMACSRRVRDIQVVG